MNTIGCMCRLDSLLGVNCREDAFSVVTPMRRLSCCHDARLPWLCPAQVAMSQGGSIDYFRTAVFNYPTLAEAYNVACRDGLRKVGIN